MLSRQPKGPPNEAVEPPGLGALPVCIVYTSLVFSLTRSVRFLPAPRLTASVRCHFGVIRAVWRVTPLVGALILPTTTGWSNGPCDPPGVASRPQGSSVVPPRRPFRDKKCGISFELEVGWEAATEYFEPDGSNRVCEISLRPGDWVSLIEESDTLDPDYPIKITVYTMGFDDLAKSQGWVPMIDGWHYSPSPGLHSYPAKPCITPWWARFEVEEMGRAHHKDGTYAGVTIERQIVLGTRNTGAWVSVSDQVVEGDARRLADSIRFAKPKAVVSR